MCTCKLKPMDDRFPSRGPTWTHGWPWPKPWPSSALQLWQSRHGRQAGSSLRFRRLAGLMCSALLCSFCPSLSVFAVECQKCKAAFTGRRAGCFSRSTSEMQWSERRPRRPDGSSGSFLPGSLLHRGGLFFSFLASGLTAEYTEFLFSSLS